MNLEHVVRALDEQNKIAAEMLSILKSQEERNARSEERQVQAHAVMIECGRLAIEREKRMAIIDAENAERMKDIRSQFQIEFPTAARPVD